MRNNQKGQVSTVFTIIITAIACVVIWFVVQKFSSYQKQSAINKAEQAQNQPSQSYKRSNAKKLASEKDLFKLLETAIKNNDDEGVTKTINTLSEVSGHQSSRQLKFSNMLQLSVSEANEFAFKVLKDQGSSCDFEDYNGNRSFPKAYNSDKDKSFELLLKYGCVSESNESHQKILKEILRSDYPARTQLLAKYMPNHEILASDYLFAIERLMSKGKEEAVLTYLDSGIDLDVNGLVNKGKRSLLEYSLYKKLPLVADKLIDLGAEVFNQNNKPATSALIMALNSKNSKIAEKILLKYPGHITQYSLAKLAFKSITNSHHAAEYNYTITKLLLENGAKVSDIRFEGVNLLRRAIGNGQLEYVGYLLKKGVNPNPLLIKYTVLGEAEKKQQPDSEKIVTLLKKFGASNDVLAIVRKARGISSNNACDIGNNKINSSIFLDAAQHINKQLKNPDFKTPKRMKKSLLCETGIVYCRNQGHGVDDCFKSIHTCSNSDDLIGVDELKTNVCCEADIKSSYIKARCSGLSVTETIMWQDRFSTSYGIPTNFH